MLPGVNSYSPPYLKPLLLQLVANYRQGRVPGWGVYWCLTPVASCLLVASLSFFWPQMYERNRFRAALTWRLCAVLWPTFLVMMSSFPVKFINKYTILSVVFGSSLMSNLTTTCCSLLPINISIFVSILVSLRQFTEQYTICHLPSPNRAQPTALLGRLWVLVSSISPLGIIVPSPERFLPHSSQCLLVYATAEIFVVSLCWYILRCIEANSRLRFLRRQSRDDFL